MNTLLLTIILVPIIEIYLFIKIGSQIGAFNTISLIFITAIIGVIYARYEGLNTLKSGLSQLFKNEVPAYEIISGAAIAFAAPSMATSWTDVEKLLTLVEETGTDVQSLDCTEGRLGFYQLEKANKIDRLVICKNNVDTDDSDAVWEVVAHEATHVMQACYGGPVVKDTYVPRILRELQETAPHYYATLQQYRGDHKRVEIEAFWMELRTPAVVMDWMTTYCFK